MKKVVTFGEIMLRLQPPNHDRLVMANSLDVTYGGGEANVAVCLSELGNATSFVTALPANELGSAAIRCMRSHGVSTSDIAIRDGRLGVYYIEKGYSVRPSVVLYDRADSAFSMSGQGDYDWDGILENADWFHFTGITAALSMSVLSTLIEGLKVAKKLGITVSCDINYRKKLWTREKASEVMSDLMQYVDVLIANEEDFKDVFKIEASGSDIEGGRLSREGYVSVAKQAMERYNMQMVAVTMRESYSASKNGWSALLYDGDAHFSRQYTLDVLDRVGGGDSFAAGLIHAVRSGKNASDTIEFAVSTSALKHTINGDFDVVSESEVERLIISGGNGRVQR